MDLHWLIGQTVFQALVVGLLCNTVRLVTFFLHPPWVAAINSLILLLLVCAMYVFPCQQLLGLSLWKGGHRVFIMGHNPLRHAVQIGRSETGPVSRTDTGPCPVCAPSVPPPAGSTTRGRTLFPHGGTLLQ